ncbi:CpaE family protein [Sphingorhabdus sp.]|uniref:AAA family ATPase n=1 Tax=Sphingorhabdus sp. TaxID=1902408 RepID=UPI00391B95EF
MGFSEQLLGKPEDWVLDLDRHSVLMVMSEAEMAAAQLDAVDAGALPILLKTLPADAEIPPSALSSASVLVLEVSPASNASLERLSAVRALYPELPVIAAVRDANLPLVRALLKQGVRDVVGLPLPHAELVEILREISTELRAKPSSEVALGQLVTIMKSIGGVGATTIATHLGSELAARNTGRGVCVFDLDLQFGDAASYLGLSSELSISDLLEAGSRIDGDLLRSVATTTEGGLHVIAAPVDMMPIEAVNADQILRIIDVARQQYDYVVLDLPTNWTNWALSLVARSTAIFLIVELSVGSLRQAKRQLQLLDSQGINGSHVHVVANRVEKRMFRAIDLDSASLALGHPVELSIHNDHPLVRAAHDQGVLIQQIRAKSKIIGDITAFLPRLGVEV